MGSANLGSVARTAAAFGLEGFRLVAPRCEWTEESKMWACYGSRLAPNIETFETLKEALQDVDISVALSRRDGRYRHRHYDLASLERMVLPEMKKPETQTAYVFGNEESGLSRADLGLCHFSAEIPVMAEDGSLNLSHAVSITLYEVLGRPSRSIEKPGPKSVHEEEAPLERLRDLIRKGRATLERVGFPKHGSTLDQEMVKVERLIQQSGLENWEMRLLLAILKQTNAHLDELEKTLGN